MAEEPNKVIGLVHVAAVVNIIIVGADSEGEKSPIFSSDKKIGVPYNYIHA